MFCATCGVQVDDRLNFCKSCGSRIAKDDSNGQNTALNSLIGVVAAVTLGGLGILIALIAVLLKNGFEHSGIGVIASIYLVVLGVVSFSLVRQIPKLIESGRRDESSQSSGVVMPAQLSPRTTAQLEEGNFQPASVTEDTTRTLQHEYRR